MTLSGRRYTVDLTSQNLAFEKNDASVLGRGSSAVVYKGMLEDKPVAIKAHDASSPCSSAVEVLLALQAFKLEGLSQAARSRVRPLGGQISPRSTLGRA